jgi:hypothetical protein
MYDHINAYPNNTSTEKNQYGSDPDEPQNTYPSPPQDINEEVCVCNLDVKLLLEQGRWVGNSQNLYESVGNCNSFHEEVKNNCFPFLLGRPCVKIGDISESEDTEGGGMNWEYSAQIRNVQCLACAENGKYTSFKIYQSILQFEEGKEGQIRPRLVSAIAYVPTLPN